MVATALAWSRADDVALGVERSRATGASGGDGLAIDVVDEVAAGEDTGDVGLRRRVLDQDVAIVVKVDLSTQQLRAGIMANRDEQARHGERTGLAGDGVAQVTLDSRPSSEWISAISEFHTR